MKIDFYYWGSMCPISNEIIQLLDDYNTIFTINYHDISNDFMVAKQQNIFFPFLTVINDQNRYYSPITASFLETLKMGIMPIEEAYQRNQGTIEREADIVPITEHNIKLSTHCTGRMNCVGCYDKIQMYDGIKDGLIGFMNIENGILLGGVEYYPSLHVPYDVPKSEDIAFLTCVYMTDTTFDYKTAPLKALEKHLSKTYKEVIVISNEKWDFPNGNLEFFIKNGYHDKTILYEDTYCKLHLLSKNLKISK